MSKRKSEDDPKLRLEAEQELNVAWHGTVPSRDPLMNDDFLINIKSENTYDEMDIGEVQIEVNTPPAIHIHKTISNTEQKRPKTAIAINTVSTNSHNTEMLSIIDDIKAVLKKINSMNERIEYKMNRITQDVAEIKVDIFDIKTKVCDGQVANPKLMSKPIIPGNIIVPESPFKNLEDYQNFEDSLKSKDVFNHTVMDFSRIGERNIDKYVRQCWRKIFIDEVAENYSWRGTNTKKSIKTSLLTLAIRSAYKRKFSTDNDNDFDKLSQKYFQYAHDRVIRQFNSKTKRDNLNTLS